MNHTVAEPPGDVPLLLDGPVEQGPQPEGYNHQERPGRWYDWRPLGDRSPWYSFARHAGGYIPDTLPFGRYADLAAQGIAMYSGLGPEYRDFTNQWYYPALRRGGPAVAAAVGTGLYKGAQSLNEWAQARVDSERVAQGREPLDSVRRQRWRNITQGIDRLSRANGSSGKCPKLVILIPIMPLPGLAPSRHGRSLEVSTPTP